MSQLFNMLSFSVLVTQSCPALCDPMDCSPPGFPIHRILQARKLEWPCPPPGDLPDPGIETGSPTLQVDSLLSEPAGKPHLAHEGTQEMFLNE